MTRVVVPEYLPERHVSILRSHADLIYDPEMYSDRPRLLTEIAGADAVLVRNRTIVDAEFLAAAGSLRVVGRLGVGLDNIDADATAASRVRVIPAKGGNSVSVAEYVVAAMLVLHRPVFAMTEAMVAGEWPRQGHAFGHELMGKVLGLVGFGSIARAVAVRGSTLGMQIVAHDPFVPDDDPVWDLADRAGLSRLLGRSDVVSIHVPLTDDTRGLLDRPTLESMRPGAILINTARGGIVDEMAVADALRSGRLGGAAIDVFESEPLSPEIAAAFEGLDNVILSPHIAGNTEESVDRVAQMTVDAVLSALGLG